MRVVPGSLGTFAGLAVDAHSRVLDAQAAPTDRTPIPGLFAVGNDAESVMGGHYPSGGITLGPAMTFGYVLAHHAAGKPLSTPHPAAASPRADDRATASRAASQANTSPGPIVMPGAG